MSTWALVPVKLPRLAKGRLGAVLGPDQRRWLTEAMLEDLLATLAEVRGLRGVAVVTAGPWKPGAGPRLIADPGGGLNTALAHAVRVLAEDGAGAVAVLPADIPFATPLEVESLLAAGREAEVVVVPDHGGRGTNALHLRPPRVMPPNFGPDSFRRHLQQGERLGLRAKSLALPGIGFDIDTPAELDRLRTEMAGRAAYRFLDREVTAAE